MKLDEINPELAKPVNLGLWSSWISIISGGLGAILAYTTPPTSNFLTDFLGFICFSVMLCGVVMLAVPRIFKWDWQTKYFGVALFHLASFSILFTIPLLYILFYTEFLSIFKLLLFIIYMALHLRWCRRYVLFYRRIYREKFLFDLLYCEFSEAIYYMQKVDKYFIDKIFHLRQVPPNIYIVICFAFGIISLFFTEYLASLTNLPFIHTFLLIFSLPVSLMCTGIATRGWLIFYYYPRKLKLEKKKLVYVDLARLPENFHAAIKSWKKARHH